MLCENAVGKKICMYFGTPYYLLPLQGQSLFAALQYRSLRPSSPCAPSSAFFNKWNCIVLIFFYFRCDNCKCVTDQVYFYSNRKKQTLFYWFFKQEFLFSLQLLKLNRYIYSRTTENFKTGETRRSVSFSACIFYKVSCN